MFDGAAMLMTVFYGLFAEGRWEDRRQANVLDGAAHYYRTYETADGKHFAVGAMEPQFYAELCARLGVDVPQDDTLDAWAAHGDTMAARFREKTRAEWEAELVTPQSCASPVLGLAEAPDHPHSQARGTFIDRRRCGATGAGAALLADGGGRTVAAVAARRPHAGGPRRARSRECRVAANAVLPARARLTEERVERWNDWTSWASTRWRATPTRPATCSTRCARPRRSGSAAAFVSERFNLKDASTLCGAVAAVTESLGIATAATNHNTRHPIVTATFATTMHRLTGGRFALGLGRGFDPMFKGMGLEPITSAQLEDVGRHPAPALERRDDPRPRRTGRHATRTSTRTPTSTRTSR